MEKRSAQALSGQALAGSGRMGILEEGPFGWCDQRLAEKPHEKAFFFDRYFLDQAVLVAAVAGAEGGAEILTMLMMIPILLYFHRGLPFVPAIDELVRAGRDGAKEDDEVDDMGQPFHAKNEFKANDASKWEQLLFLERV